MHGDLQRHTYPESAESNSYENPTCLKPEKVKLNSSYALIVGFSDTHIFFSIILQIDTFYGAQDMHYDQKCG